MNVKQVIACVSYLNPTKGFMEHFDWLKARWQPRPKFNVNLSEFFREVISS
jgi:hypothetical protein